MLFRGPRHGHCLDRCARRLPPSSRVLGGLTVGTHPPPAAAAVLVVANQHGGLAAWDVSTAACAAPAGTRVAAVTRSVAVGAPISSARGDEAALRGGGCRGGGRRRAAVVTGALDGTQCESGGGAAGAAGGGVGQAPVSFGGKGWAGRGAVHAKALVLHAPFWSAQALHPPSSSYNYVVCSLRP